MAVHLSRRRMDTGLLAGNTGFHGVRRPWTSAARRSRFSARDNQDPICRLLVRGGGAADCAVKRSLAASAAFDRVLNRSNDSARHENDEKNEKDYIDCVGCADEVCAERNPQALVQGNGQ